MKFLLDENAEFRIAAFLRARGHDVTSIAHDYPASLPDEQVLAIARSEGRILITNDRDFGELIIRRRLAHAGVLFFRLRTQGPQAKLDRLADVLTQHSAQLDQFLIITERQIRVRRRPSAGQSEQPESP